MSGVIGRQLPHTGKSSFVYKGETSFFIMVIFDFYGSLYTVDGEANTTIV